MRATRKRGSTVRLLSRRPLRRTLVATLALGATGLGLAVPAAAAGASAAGTSPADSSPTTVVTGTVTGVDGMPLQHVQVVATFIDGATYTPASTTTARNGSYRLRVPEFPVGGDHFHVQFLAAAAVGGTSATGYADRCHLGSSICVQSDPGNTLTGRPTVLDQVLARAGVLRGRVTDALGRGVGGLPVTANPRNGLPAGVDGPSGATTDLDGNYAINRLNPSTYDLTYGDTTIEDPAAVTSAATPNPDGYVTLASSVAVTSGRTTTANVTVVGGGAIRGTVVDARGVPVAGATVRQPNPRAASTTTAADGTLVLHRLVPGQVTVYVDTGSSSSEHQVATVRSFRTATVQLVLPSAA